MAYVKCNIRYRDGNLSGLLILDGFSVTEIDQISACKTLTWIANHIRDNAPVSSTITGNHYDFVGIPRIEVL